MKCSDFRVFPGLISLFSLNIAGTLSKFMYDWPEQCRNSMRKTFLATANLYNRKRLKDVRSYAKTRTVIRINLSPQNLTNTNKKDSSTIRTNVLIFQREEDSLKMESSTQNQFNILYPDKKLDMVLRSSKEEVQNKVIVLLQILCGILVRTHRLVSGGARLAFINKV